MNKTIGIIISIFLLVFMATSCRCAISVADVELLSYPDKVQYVKGEEERIDLSGLKYKTYYSDYTCEITEEEGMLDYSDNDYGEYYKYHYETNVDFSKVGSYTLKLLLWTENGKVVFEIPIKVIPE